MSSNDYEDDWASVRVPDQIAREEQESSFTISLVRPRALESDLGLGETWRRGLAHLVANIDVGAGIMRGPDHAAAIELFARLYAAEPRDTCDLAVEKYLLEMGVDHLMVWSISNAYAAVVVLAHADYAGQWPHDIVDRLMSDEANN